LCVVVGEIIISVLGVLNFLKASFITPVPGGVGPMTIAMLLKNTLLAREQKRNR